MGRILLLAILVAGIGFSSERGDEFHSASLERIHVIESELVGMLDLQAADQLDSLANRLGPYRDAIAPLTEVPSMVRDTAVSAIELIEVTAILVDDRDEENVVFGIYFLLQEVRAMKAVLERVVRIQ